MGKKLLILLVILAAFLAPKIYHFIFMMGHYKSHYNHQPGPCRLLRGIEYGSEDFELMPDNKLLITSGLRLFGSEGKDPPKDLHGRVYMFDFNHPDDDPVELELKGLPSTVDFNPHGISSWAENDEVIVYIVCHLQASTVVLSFLYRDKRLIYRDTHTDASFTMINDVTAVGKDKFYFTNFQYFRASPVETLIGFAWSSVGFYDASNGKILVSGLVGANGINKSPDGRYIYVADAGLNGVRIYERNKDNSLTEIEAKCLSTYVDNIMVDPETGDLWLGCHYVMNRLAEYAGNPKINTAPAQVLRLRVESGHVTSITEALMDDGSLFSGSSVALYRNNKLVVGSIYTKAMSCDVKYI